MSKPEPKAKRGRPVVKVELEPKELDALREMFEEDPLPAEAIRLTRHALGMTQNDFGESIGATRRTIQDYESGMRNCRGAWRLAVIGTAKKIKASA